MLRFRLRTLFLFLTLIALALGWVIWQRTIVRQRREFLKTLRQQNEHYLTVTDSRDAMLLGLTVENDTETHIGIIPQADLAMGRKPLGPWSLRRWLVDVTIARIWIKKRTPPYIVELAKRLAPEASLDGYSLP